MPATILLTKGRNFASGTYSPKGTRCILSLRPSTSPSGARRKALFRYLICVPRFQRRGCRLSCKFFNSAARDLIRAAY